MLKYILYRLLLIVPTLLVICIFSFFLFHSSSTDPVDSLLNIRGIQDAENKYVDYEKEYNKLAREMKLDIPMFYFSILPSYYPDDFYKITNKGKKEKYKSLLERYKDWRLIQNVDKLIARLENHQTEPVSENRTAIENTIVQLKRNHSHEDRMAQLQFLEQEYISLNSTELSNEINQVSNAMHKAFEQNIFFYPKVKVHGFSNQFHHWFIGLFSGSKQLSLADGLPIKQKIKSGLQWSLSMSIISILLALLISIPLGFWSASHQNSRFEKSLSILLYFIYAMPVFWLATLLIVYFTNDYYAKWMNIFPSVGIFYSKDTSFVSQFIDHSKLLILPIYCLTIHSLVYLIRQIRMSMLLEMEQPYYFNALSKGLTKRKAMLVHILPNALIPLITIIIGAIPGAFAGSLVIEVLFNIPGMGRLMFQAIQLDDWTMISALLFIVASATVIFYLIGDILYTWFNPKIRFS